MKINKFSILKIILVLIAIALAVIITLKSNHQYGDFKKYINYSGTDMTTAYESITCIYPQTLQAVFLENQVIHQLPKAQLNPLIFTFTDYTNTEMAQLSYIDSTQMITTVPIFKIADDEDKMIFIEGTGDNYITMHYIHKKLGVASYAKGVSLLGIPSSTLAMGTCAGY